MEFDLKEFNLKEFELEVVNKGALACLPGNLSNKWLHILSETFESVFLGEEDISLAAPMMAIAQIMSFKLNKSEFSIEGEDMKRLIESYRLEITFEVVSRATDMEVNRADLQSIFTNRNVQFRKK
jgi:hypothetical protein